MTISHGLQNKMIPKYRSICVMSSGKVPMKGDNENMARTPERIQAVRQASHDSPGKSKG